MRDRETIALRVAIADRRSPGVPSRGTLPSIGPVHELLDERAELTGSSPLGHQPRDRVGITIADLLYLDVDHVVPEST